MKLSLFLLSVECHINKGNFACTEAGCEFLWNMRVKGVFK